MNARVAIIILNYNGWQDTLECLDSVFQVSYDSFTVVLVDNASQDDSLLRIEDYYTRAPSTTDERLPRLVQCTREEIEEGPRAGLDFALLPPGQASVLIKNERNYGFAEGANVGIRFAVKTLDPDFVLLLNNDTTVEKDLLQCLIDSASRDNRIGLVQPKILRYADSKIDQAGILCDILGFTRHRGWGENDRGQYDEETESGFFYAGGACLLVSRNLLRDLPDTCFDPYLFAYHEDVDLSWVARLLGYKVVYCPTALCRHKGGATSGGQNPQTARLVYKNRLRVLIKNYSLTTLAVALPVTVLLKLFLLGAGAIVNTNPRYLRSFLRALSWNTVNLRSTLRRRRFIQSRRTVTDKEVLKYMVRYSLEADSVLKALSLRHGP